MSSETKEYFKYCIKLFKAGVLYPLQGLPAESAQERFGILCLSHRARLGGVT